MSNTTKYFSLQGRLSFGKRLPSGKPGAIVWAQNASKLDISFEVSEESTKESHSGNRMKDYIFETEKNLTTAFTLSGFTLPNLLRAFWASKFDVSGNTVSGEIFAETYAVGDYFKLNHENTSDWSLVDSTGTPVPLVEGTHYAVTSYFAGMGEILSLNGLTQPIKANYDYASSQALSLLQNRADEHYLIFDGIDTVSKSRAYLEIPRHSSKPIKSLPLINNDGLGSMEMEGEALYNGDVDFPLGKFVISGA